ncbi:MAG: PaaI family thioesterase [Candidatus Accumulibacter sp.]|nr:PaaI family thioesterase [Accumulibacter sp.]
MHKIQDPHFAERVRANFASQQAMALIGAQMMVVKPGYTEIHLPYKPEICQQHGYIHGGVVGMIADSAAGYAASTLTAADTAVLTVEYKLNLLAPAEGQRLVAEGSVVRYGRTLIVTRAEVFAFKDQRRKVCALMQQTIIAVPGEPETPAAASGT